MLCYAMLCLTLTLILTLNLTVYNMGPGKLHTSLNFIHPIIIASVESNVDKQRFNVREEKRLNLDYRASVRHV